MQFVATFEYSSLLEIGLTELKEKEVSGIYVVPLDLRKKEPRLLDSIQKGDVVLIVTCEERQASVVEDILWDHKALGLARTR